MNQFDEFFKDKLNEEQQFSGQKRSWTQLNRELHLIEKGTGIASKTLALWKALGIVAILISIGLIWERQHLIAINKKLKTALNEQQVQTSQNDSVSDISTPNTTSLNTSSSSNTTADVKPSPASGEAPSAPQHSAFSTGAEKPKQANGKTKPLSDPKRQTIQNSDTKAAVNPDKKKVDFAGNKSDSENKPQPAVATNSNSESLQPAATPPLGSEPRIDPTNQAPESVIAAVDSLKSVIDSASVASNQAPISAKDSSAVQVVQEVDSIRNQALVKAPEKIIDPLKNREKRWLAGIRVVAGFPQPKEPGVSTIIGQGIGIAYRFWNNFSVTASADFLKFDVDAASVPEHCSDIELPQPGPGHHFFDLKNISANRTMQQYSVGLSYSHKLIGAWSVSLNSAHSWTYLPSRLVSFRFEEMHGPWPGPGHPEVEFLAEHSEKNWISNVWKLGAGLNYNLPRWSFGVKADYSKGLNNTRPSMEALIASAEVMYKF